MKSVMPAVQHRKIVGTKRDTIREFDQVQKIKQKKYRIKEAQRQMQSNIAIWKSV
jgi:hypothetical protein